ncbi:MAG: adenylate/guanylate cyclase domain-containing protein [Rhodoferax sp.]
MLVATPPPQWGELKVATIFFADIVSSTTHIANLDPEQAMEQLQPAVQRMCDSVDAFGGTVVRTMGDGILALFGVPHTLEGHAMLACEAALALQRAFQGNQFGLQVRVGLHSGLVASDPQAADAAIGGGVHGRAIHLASRVVGVAEPGGICLTADCLALIGTACEVQNLGLHTLKGIAEPTEIHSLLRMQSDTPDDHFHRAALSPLRGRANELAALQQALLRTEKGQGAVIGLVGAAGTGKSRLCFEFVQWCRTRLVSITEVRTQLYGYATPLAPVLALLRGWFFHITPADDAVATRGRIAARLSRLGVAGNEDLALFNEFLGVGDPAGAQCSLNPKARRARLLALFGDMVRYSGTTTSVIAVEDLHWIDEASLEFLDVLVHAVVGTRTLVLFHYRTRFVPPWSALPHFRKIDLAELGAADTEALVQALVGPGRSRAEWHEVLALIVARSAGNPFFAEELVRSLLEGGTLSSQPGALPPSLVALAQELPATVQAVIGARIDRLGSTQKTVLHICAVIGKEVPLPVLQQVALYLASQIEYELAGLCDAELLQLVREIAGGRRFAFRHPLIQEVAYSTQFKARRANLHAAVAVAMEAHYRTQPDEFAALIAYHYASAGQFVKAAQHEARAAKWAGSTNSGQAINHWRKVWTLLEGQARSQQVNSLRAVAGGRIVYLGWREGLSPEEVEQVIPEAIGHANEVDSRLVQLLLFAQGRILQSGGGAADDYVDCVLKALSLTPPGGDTGRVAMLNVALSQAYAWAGMLEQGLAANDAALLGVASIDKFDREFIDFSIEQWMLGIRVRLLIRMNRLADAQACLRQMLAADEMLNDPVIRQITHHLHVEFAAITQNPTLAQEHVAIVVSLARQYASPYSKIFALWCSGLAEISAGNLAAAQRSFSEALELIASTKVAMEFEAEIRANLTECHYKLGNFELALEAVKENIGISKARNNRLAECRALIILGGVLSQKTNTDSWGKALEFFNEAERLIGLTGAKVYEPALLSERDRLMKLMKQ